ncbi:MAG: lysine--tRNA ligase, partial [Gallionellaceae bacterium]|nr:lysine--tRNA ligase [Gallionellaceae bacterium]
MTTPTNTPAVELQDENKIIAERRAKLAALRKQGIAFPNDFQREHLAADIHASYGELGNEQFEANPVKVT